MSKYKRKLNIKWFATTKLGIEELAKNTDFSLTSSDFRLLFYLLSKIDEDNLATLPKQKDISTEINISVRKISEGLRRLHEAKIIVKSGKPKTYFINPAFLRSCLHHRIFSADVIRHNRNIIMNGNIF